MNSVTGVLDAGGYEISIDCRDTASVPRWGMTLKNTELSVVALGDGEKAIGVSCPMRRVSCIKKNPADLSELLPSESTGACPRTLTVAHIWLPPAGVVGGPRPAE